MSKEFGIIEVNAETVAPAVEQSLTQLNELSLALIGGGSATVVF